MTEKFDDGIQHGLDDNTEHDPTKGAVLGGIGGAVVGAAAGGPIGAVVGAVAGAAASGASVAAVHDHTNENNVTGIGDSVTIDKDATDDDLTEYAGDDYVDTTGTSTTSRTL